MSGEMARQKQMPEEGVFTPGGRDPVTGAQWIHVTPGMARNHPQGRLNLILWAIVGYYLAMAGLRVEQAVEWGGVPSGAFVLATLMPLLCAAGLAFRVPWAVLIVTALSALSVLSNLSVIGAGNPAVVVEIIVTVLIILYLLEGDRPNLIYRHRYRSYRGGGDE